jgi:molecular chaperone GrpE (heat shock protein)
MSDDDTQQDDQNPNVSIDQLQNDLDLANNNWKRALADFENYKRRKEGENKELVEFAREVTVAKLLPTLDSLEQALKHMPEFHPPLTPPLKGGETAVDIGSIPSPLGGGLGRGDFF